VAVLAWQSKKRVTVSTYYQDEMHVAVNKANQKETKPMVVYHYSEITYLLE
jgi:hypothetical protein